MPLQLTLIAHAPTAATRASGFPDDDPLDPPITTLANPFRRIDQAWTSPAQAARQTATALGLTATPDPALRELDLGTWTGRPLEDIAQPDLAAWYTDPTATPHGGESVQTLIARIAAWLETLDPIPSNHRIVAITHASVLRAALVAALQAPPTAFWAIDAAPLTRLRLNRNQGRPWILRALGPLTTVDRPAAR